MHVVVIGAGVIGVTTAYYLSRLGCQVTVIDRNPDVACGATFANAGQLSYSFTDALARPEFIARLPSLLARREDAIRLRFAPDLIPWGLRFLAQCTNRQANENTAAVLKVALRSESLMQELLQEIPFGFSYQPAGKLVLLDNEKELDAARASVALKRDLGCDTQILDPVAAKQVEPALAGFSSAFVAAVYSKHDAVADSYAFTVGLRKMLTASGRVKFKLDSNVSKLNRDGRRLHSVELTDEKIDADAVVICAGARSAELLRPLGINPYVYPVRGYSLTLPTGDTSPAVSVTVSSKKIVFSHINGSMRIAGFADFAGYRTAADEQRIAALSNIAREYAPLAADYDAEDRTQWGGFRPMTPDGRPVVGPTGINGLYLNTGHGMLGWTLACATGSDVAEAVAGTPY